MMARAQLAVGVVCALLLASTNARAEDEPSTSGRSSEFELDATLLNVGASVAARTDKHSLVGFGVSAFPGLALQTFRAYPVEVTEAHAFGRMEPASWMQLDGGIRGGYFEELCVLGPCPKGMLYGPYADARFGWHRFKLGPRVELAFRSDTGEAGVLYYPLLVRVQLSP